MVEDSVQNSGLSLRAAIDRARERRQLTSSGLRSYSVFRNYRLWPTLDRLLQDIRYAVRSLRKSRGFRGLRGDAGNGRTARCRPYGGFDGIAGTEPRAGNLVVEVRATDGVTAAEVALLLAMVAFTATY